VLALALLGAGNGSVFQLVPLRFRREIGVVTGLVGAAGGLGGFLLPAALGVLKDVSGSYAGGLLALVFLCLWGMTLVLAVSGGWRLTWAGQAGDAQVVRPTVQAERPSRPSGDSRVPVAARR